MKSDITKIDCPHFWAGYFSSHFGHIGEPIEFDDVADIFNVSSEATFDWWNQFTNYYEGVFDESDGQVEEPGTISIKNNGVTLLFEFHPGDTYLFTCGTKEEKLKLGNIGPHWELPAFRWQEVYEFYNRTGAWREFLLFLPWVWIEKSSWDDKCEQSIMNILMKFTTDTKADKFYEKWFNAVAGDYGWKLINDIGWASDSHWSTRFYKNDPKQLLRINSMIGQFIKESTNKSVNRLM